MKSNLAPLMSSDRMDWRTPENVLERVRRVGPIGLDPCASYEGSVGAGCEWHGDDRDGLSSTWWDRDGLSSSWWGPCLAYVNPPYGRELPKWIAKCSDEALRHVEILLLVPARTDTKAFYTFIAPPLSQAICFWRGRLTFVGAPASAPFPSMLVYWGPRVDRFVAAFHDAGAIWRNDK